MENESFSERLFNGRKRGSENFTFVPCEGKASSKSARICCPSSFCAAFTLTRTEEARALVVVQHLCFLVYKHYFKVDWNANSYMQVFKGQKKHVKEKTPTLRGPGRQNQESTCSLTDTGMTTPALQHWPPSRSRTHPRCSCPAAIQYFHKGPLISWEISRFL